MFLALINLEKENYLWIPDFSMGDIKLSGLGYDTVPIYENITFTGQTINLKGINAGYLNYGKTYKLYGITRTLSDSYGQSCRPE